MIILRLLLLLTNLHLKLLSTQGTGADKLLSTQRVKDIKKVICEQFRYNVKRYFTISFPLSIIINLRTYLVNRSKVSSKLQKMYKKNVFLLFIICASLHSLNKAC